MKRKKIMDKYFIFIDNSIILTIFGTMVEKAYDD